MRFLCVSVSDLSWVFIGYKKSTFYVLKTRPDKVMRFHKTKSKSRASEESQTYIVRTPGAGRTPPDSEWPTSQGSSWWRTSLSSHHLSPAPLCNAKRINDLLPPAGGESAGWRWESASPRGFLSSTRACYVSKDGHIKPSDDTSQLKMFICTYGRGPQASTLCGVYPWRWQKTAQNGRITYQAEHKMDSTAVSSYGCCVKRWVVSKSHLQMSHTGENKDKSTRRNISRPLAQ